MRVIPLKSYSDFKKLIPNRFIESKGVKLHDFRVAVGNAVQRYRNKHLITKGNEDYRHKRWQKWLSTIDFGGDPDGDIIATLDDDIAGELHRGLRHVAFYITLYYKLHSILDDLSYADDIDDLVFGEPLRERGDVVFIHDCQPIAPFKHPLYLSKERVGDILSKNPLDSVWLNPHNHHSLPFSPRDDIIAALNRFVSSDVPFQIQPLIGPSGSGKTRLMSQWMRDYVEGINSLHWDAGIVESRSSAPWSVKEDGGKWEIEANTLIVIDYTFAYDDVVEQIVERARNNQSQHKIRCKRCPVGT